MSWVAQFIQGAVFLVLFVILGMIAIPVGLIWMIYAGLYFLYTKIRRNRPTSRWSRLAEMDVPLYLQLGNPDMFVYLYARVSGLSKRQALREVVANQDWYRSKARRKIEPVMNMEGYKLRYISPSEDGWQGISYSIGGPAIPRGRYIWYNTETGREIPA